MITCVVGLGNPGGRYVGTRHNLGFEVADMYAAQHAAQWQWRLWRPYWHAETTDGILVVKPATFMNNSGNAVAAVHRRWGCLPENFLIVYDDVHLPVGQLRARRSGSDGGHNGLSSIIRTLGTEKIPRLRIGIGDDPHDRIRHVLGRFQTEELPVMHTACAAAATAIDAFTTQPWETAAGMLQADPAREHTGNNNNCTDETVHE